MPLKSRTFDGAEASYFNVSSFLAVLAFPDNEDREHKFRDQLRLACLRQASMRVRTPAIIEVPLHVFQTEFDRGFYSDSLEILYRRFGLGLIALRQTGLWDEKEYSGKTTSLLDEFVDELGHTSVTTAFADQWKPAWPVLHASASLARDAMIMKHPVPANISTRELQLEMETWKFSDYSRSEFEELIIQMMMTNGKEFELVASANEVSKRMIERQVYKKIRESEMIEFKIAAPQNQPDRQWWKGKNWKTTSSIDFR